VVEKPFGHDLASARALNAELRMLLEEWQILRIDHFLGKEPVMDIMYLRFTNSVFEPLWNRDRIESVQNTMAEDFGVEDRQFLRPGRVLRDVMQNHLVQLIALFACEPPAAGHPTSASSATPQLETPASSPEKTAWRKPGASSSPCSMCRPR
jgi:glucose-6-phosphate 1-dehydrogenase